VQLLRRLPLPDLLFRPGPRLTRDNTGAPPAVKGGRRHARRLWRPMREFTHFNGEGRARMVNVSGKEVTERTATARGTVQLDPETFAAVMEGRMRKGDVLAVAQVGGIMGAKRTPDLIPMCHPINITGADIRFSPDPAAHCIEIEATVSCSGVTGVEMEALTAVTVAALTIYDMCKAMQKDIVIKDIRLMKKTGGKSGTFERQE
jgi:cyclic pyranopterin phosphate synthase